MLLLQNFGIFELWHLITLPFRASAAAQVLSCKLSAFLLLVWSSGRRGPTAAGSEATRAALPDLNGSLLPLLPPTGIACSSSALGLPRTLVEIQWLSSASSSGYCDSDLLAGSAASAASKQFNFWEPAWESSHWASLNCSHLHSRESKNVQQCWPAKEAIM